MGFLRRLLGIERRPGEPEPLSDERFERAVAGSDRPAVVLFYGLWCSQCQVVHGLLNELGPHYAHLARFYRLDVAKHPAAPSRLKITGVPRVVLFRDGRPVESESGLMTLNDLRAWLERNLGSPDGGGPGGDQGGSAGGGAAGGGAPGGNSGADPGGSTNGGPGGGAAGGGIGGAALGAALAVLFLLAGAPRAHATSDVFFRFAAGAIQPFAANLDGELAAQGRPAPQIGYTAGVSLGRNFSERRWGGELWFDVARSRNFIYRNEYDDFDGYLSDYSFMLVGKRNLMPDSERSSPYIGLGLGYGSTAIARGPGKVEGFRAMVLLQFESRIRDNIALLVEGSYLSALAEKRYSSPFLDASSQDQILDSEGLPLSERFASLGLRLGIVVRLNPPSPYYGR